MNTGLVDLKARVDLAELASRHTKLTKRGRALWGCCPIHSENTPSFKVEGDRFHCFGCGAHGDVIDFVVAVEGVSMPEIVKKLRELAGGSKPWQRPPPAPRPVPPKSNNLVDAVEIWRETTRIRDRPALDYLVCRRGITTWDEDRVRWHPKWGGIIVCPVVSAATGYTTAIWCIRPSMTGKVARWGYGPCKGNFAPIWWPEGDEIAIAEGIEDALAVHQREGTPCWSAMNAGNMGELGGIPSFIRRVTIYADRDLAGQRGAYALADRLRAEGRHARVLEAMNHKDPNEILLAGGSP